MKQDCLSCRDLFSYIERQTIHYPLCNAPLIQQQECDLFWQIDKSDLGTDGLRLAHSNVEECHHTYIQNTQRFFVAG